MENVEPGKQLGIKVFVALAMEGLFDSWLDLDDNEIGLGLRASTRLRSILKVHCYRRFESNGWDVYVQLFDKFPLIPFDKLNEMAQSSLLGLVARDGIDGFATVEKNASGNELHYMHYVHDEQITEYLQNGLGILLFSCALGIPCGGGDDDREYICAELHVHTERQLGKKLCNEVFHFIKESHEWE